MLTEESGHHAVGNDLFTDFAHPNIRAHQRIAEAVANALREAGEIAPSDRWRGGYQPPDPADLHRADPDLHRREVNSRVVVCIVSDRPECEADARELLALEPTSRLAQAVLRGLRVRGMLAGQRGGADRRSPHRDR